MKLTLPPYGNARVLVLGDIMLDRYWQGDTTRVSPEAPVPVVRVSDIKDRPGGAGNVALNIAALGSGSLLRGYTGADEMADSLEDMLGGAAVDCDFERVEGHPTITKLRVISRQQQLIRLDFEEAALSSEGQPLHEGLASRLEGCGAVVLSDYAKGALADPQPLIQAARAASVPVLVDPKGSDFARYRGATLLTPNRHEFEAVVGAWSSESELVSKGEALIRWVLNSVLVVFIAKLLFFP